MYTDYAITYALILYEIRDTHTQMLHLGTAYSNYCGRSIARCNGNINLIKMI